MKVPRTLLYPVLGAFACSCGVLATNGATGLSTPKIDTHSHVYPDWYRQAVIDAGWVPGVSLSERSMEKSY